MNKALDGAATLTAMVIRLEAERDAAIARAERAEAALDERDKLCVWHKSHAPRDLRGLVSMALYRTACNRSVFPPEQDFEYCPYCGHPMQIAPSDESEW